MTKLAAELSKNLRIINAKPQSRVKRWRCKVKADDTHTSSASHVSPNSRLRPTRSMVVFNVLSLLMKPANRTNLIKTSILYPQLSR